MEILKEIVRGIALIIIFAGFMEMLLPDSEMRRYIKVVVGLFVIISIISPLAQFINQEKSLEVASWHIPQDNTQQLIEKGQKIAKEAQSNVSAGNNKRIAAQINALTKLHQGVESADVEVGQIDENGAVKVSIKLTTHQKLSAEEQNILTQQVSETVTAFFDYPRENIEIIY